VVGLAATAGAWMAKWFYGLIGRRVMDHRLAPDFMRQMTLRYGLGALIQVAAVPLAFVAPRPAVGLALLCVVAFLLPQPKPRYKPGEEPNPDEYLDGQG
jgi:hypothetical protein